LSEVRARGSFVAADHVYPKPWRVIDAETGEHLVDVTESGVLRSAAELAKRTARATFRSVALVDAEGDVIARYTVHVSIREHR
jgi:hypothetical protein